MSQRDLLPTDAWRWRSVIGLIVLTMVVRGGVLAVRWSSLERDPDAYRLISENLLSHGTMSRAEPGQALVPTAFRPPLYPLTLALFGRQGKVPWPNVAICHLLLGTGTVVLVFLLARQCGLHQMAWLAALLTAVDPILLNQSTLVMTETEATLTAVACAVTLVAWARHRATTRTTCLLGFLAGFLLAVASLCRPTFLVWGGLCCVAELVRGKGRVAGMRAAVLAAGLVVGLLPWVARNYVALGRPVIATTHGGYTLLLGNNRFFYRHLETQPWGTVWQADQLRPLVLKETRVAHATHPDQHPELSADQRLYTIARQTISHEPRLFAWSCLVRLGRFWRPWPHRLTEYSSMGSVFVQGATGVWYVVWFTLALAGVWRLGRRLGDAQWLWAALLLLAFSAVHCLYWSNLRMRGPLMPSVYLLAVVGLSSRTWLTRRT